MEPLLPTTPLFEYDAAVIESTDDSDGTAPRTTTAGRPPPPAFQWNHYRQSLSLGGALLASKAAPSNSSVAATPESRSAPAQGAPLLEAMRRPFVRAESPALPRRRRFEARS